MKTINRTKAHTTPIKKVGCCHRKSYLLFIYSVVLWASTIGAFQERILDRFINPKIQDPALPLTEAGLAQICAPTFQLLWLRSANSPLPSWTLPLYDTTFVLPRGYLLAPTLIHGSGLACCWILGSLAVKGYEQKVVEGNWKKVLFSTARAGAFATGLLIFGTQFDLYQEMGYVQVGDSPETDLRIYQALVETINDIFFEALVLFPWRLFRSKAATLR